MNILAGNVGEKTCFGERRWLPLVFLSVLLVAGGWLAVNRIFQVDEVQTMHMAWLLAQPDANQYFNSAEAYLLPLALLSRAFQDPLAYIVACRLIFYAVFLASGCLLARGVAGRSRTKFYGALCLLGTMPVLWDFGFEVRHDNVVILGLVLMMRMLFADHTESEGRSLFWGGCLGGVLFLSSFKSIVLWAPILVMLALSRVIGRRVSLTRAMGAVAGGLVTATIVVFLIHFLAGSLALYVKSARGFFMSVGGEGIRFFDWTYLWRFARHQPWLLCMSAVFLVVEGRWIFGAGFVGREGGRPDTRAKEFILLILGPIFLALNPAPFPYNYLYIVVLAFPAVFHMTTKLFDIIPVKPALLLAVIIVIQGLSAVPQMIRHFSYTNGSQRRAIAYLNAYTDREDRVFDGAGLAMFRKGPGEMWYLHSLNKAGYRAGIFPSVRNMLTQNRCPILLQSYKWDFMQSEDLEFIKSHYVPFRMAVWILGSRIPIYEPGASDFNIFYDGFYLFCTWNMEPVSEISVDGTPVNPQAVFLRKGEHRLKAEKSAGAVFALWVKNGRFLPPQVPELTLPLYVNWY